MFLARPLRPRQGALCPWLLHVLSRQPLATGLQSAHDCYRSSPGDRNHIDRYLQGSFVLAFIFSEVMSEAVCLDTGLFFVFRTTRSSDINRSTNYGGTDLNCCGNDGHRGICNRHHCTTATGKRKHNRQYVVAHRFLSGWGWVRRQVGRSVRQGSLFASDIRNGQRENTGVAPTSRQTKPKRKPKTAPA